MLITAISGTEAFSMGASKFHLWFSPSLQFPGKETHIGQMARLQDPNIPIQVVGQPRFFPAAPGYREDMGKWTQAVYDVPEGIVLKVFGYRKLSNQSYPTTGSQYIRMRQGAATRKIKFNTVGWNKGQFQQVEVSGNFDLITVEEGNQIGVRTPPQYARGFDPQHLRSVFTYEEIATERKAAPQLETRTIMDSNGKPVEVHTRRNRRDLAL